MTRTGISGIVLAGGASSRFGGDKLASRFDGRGLLDRSIDALAQLCSEVIVVLAPEDDRVLRAASGSVPIRPVHDPERHGGPLLGLLTGIETAREPIALVAGGDMPTMSAAVLRAVVAALIAAESSADAAVLVQRSVDQPLPVAFRNGAATQAIRRLVGDGERSLMSLLRALPVRRLAEGEWRGLDPEAETLRDVDRPADLSPPET